MKLRRPIDDTMQFALKAIKGGWPVKPEMRVRVIERAMEIINDPEELLKYVLPAMHVILLAQVQNDRNEARDESAMDRDTLALKAVIDRAMKNPLVRKAILESGFEEGAMPPDTAGEEGSDMLKLPGG